MENKQEKILSKIKQEFPIDVLVIPFTRYSHFPTNINDENNQQLTKQQQKNIIIGGYFNNGDGFYEFHVHDHDNSNSINYKSFTNNYNKKFANLKHMCIHF